MPVRSAITHGFHRDSQRKGSPDEPQAVINACLLTWHGPVEHLAHLEDIPAVVSPMPCKGCVESRLDDDSRPWMLV